MQFDLDEGQRSEWSNAGIRTWSELTGTGGKIIMTRKENSLEPGVRYLIGVLSSRWKESCEGLLVRDCGNYCGSESGIGGDHQQSFSGSLSPGWSNSVE